MYKMKRRHEENDDNDHYNNDHYNNGNANKHFKPTKPTQNEIYGMQFFFSFLFYYFLSCLFFEKQKHSENNAIITKRTTKSIRFSIQQQAIKCNVFR